MSYENIGVLDPEGININPLTGYDYQDVYSNNPDNVNYPPPEDDIGRPLPKTYANYAKRWSKLPVYERKISLLQTIENHRVTLIKAGTGSGKTVLVPVFALHSFNYKKKIAVCIPKVIPVKSSARYAALRLDVELGNQVGYTTGQPPDIMSNDTILLYFSTGKLVQKMSVGGDPYLKDFECVIIDEVHERQSETDFLMYLLRKVLDERPEFKVIIMSATINFTIFQDYFKNYSFKEFDAGGETPYPIEPHFLEKPLKSSIEWEKEAIKTIVHILTTTDSGDILIFMAGADRKKRLCTQLDKAMDKYMENNPDSKIVPFCTSLYSKIDGKNEELATDKDKYKELIKESGYNKGKHYTRKVIFSTNVAESSVTVKGLKYVIDSGLENESDYDYKTNCSVLITKYASQSSIIQRKGRGGRTGPGVCYHLYTKEQFNNFSKFSKPNIFKEDYWKTLERGINLPYIKTIGDIREFSQSFIQKQDIVVVNTLIRKLYHLGYFTSTDDDGVLSWLGKALLDLKLEPSLTRALIASYYYGVQTYIVPILAIQDNSNFTGSFSVLDDTLAKQDETYKKQYQNFFNRLRNNYGDVLSILDLYLTYDATKKELKRMQGFNDEEIKEEMKTWSKKHFIQHKVFEDLNKNISAMKEKLYKLMESYVDEENGITMEDVLKHSFDINYMNTVENPIYKILLTLFEGYFIYACKKKGDGKFKLIYPKKTNTNTTNTNNNTKKKPSAIASIGEIIPQSAKKFYKKLFNLEENTFLKIKNDIIFGNTFFKKLNDKLPTPMEVDIISPNNIPEYCIEYVKEKYKDILNLY